MARPAKRTSTGKTKRFEVFKRDHFTCQYCGAQPPAAVLVVDHIDPVIRGGASAIENLITACQPCNQGKAARPLGLRQVRPDADLLYLEAQQEIAELKRFQEAVEERNRHLQQAMEFIRAQWCLESGLDWGPSDFVLRQLLRAFPPDIVLDAALVVAPKVAGGYVRKDWVPYMWGVVRAMNKARMEDDEVVDWGTQYLEGLRQRRVGGEG